MITTVPRPQPSAFAVFRNRSFTLLWTASLLSTIGSALTSLAASILVYRLTGSALSVGLMLMATAGPSLVVGLIAGVFVDRLDRKRIMIVADVIRAVLVALIPFLLPFGIVWLYVIVMVSSAVGQFHEPAHASILPEVASDEDLAAANALMQISSFGSTAFGFALAGLITSRFPIAWAFYLDSVSYVLSAVCILLVHIPPPNVEGHSSVAAVLRNLKGGVAFLFRTPLLRSLFVICLPVFLGYGLHNALLLPFAVRALGASEFEYGLLEGLSAGGFIVGALLMVRLTDRLHEGQWVALSYLAIGLGKFVVAPLSSVPLALGIYTILGIVNAPNYIGRSLIIQRYTPREMRGRVNSAFLVTRNVMYLLGMGAAGLADVFDVRWLLVISAVLVVCGGLLVLVLPGLGQPAAEWRQTLAMLRSARSAPGLGRGRAATLADLDHLALRLPALAGLGSADRRSLAHEARIYDAPAGTAIVRQGEQSDAAYFILDGQAVAGRDDVESYQSLEVLQAGDFFGEIAALTGAARTANVIAEQPTQVLQVPAATVRRMMADAQFNRLVMSKMTERMLRMNMLDLPRLGVLDQQSLRELRTPDPHAG